MPDTNDMELLRRALTLAAQGPAVDPNPRVGAVITAPTGEVVGEGWHRGAGTPHAEIAALADAGDRARGGTAYVSLEPCNHIGRTGPCSQALIDAGIRRVVFAQADPSPAASGGADSLRAAGVEVEVEVVGVEDSLAAEAAALNPDWTFAVTHGRPRVVWKYAATLDGRSAAADGTSRWITSPEARADSHDLRARCGAILVGTGTVLTDDPHLTVRHPDGTLREHQPLRVVLGQRALPADARVLDTAADTLRLPHREPVTALTELDHRGVRRVWLEGGPTLAAAFWRAGLIDEVVAYLAPALLGAGSAAVGDLRITTIADISRLTLTDVRQIGPDLRILADPRPDPQEDHVHRNR